MEFDERVPQRIVPEDRPVPAEDGAATGAAVTIVVCATCRDGTEVDGAPRPGAVFAGRVRDAAAGRVRVRQVDCLGNCRRPLSAAILRDGGWSYVFGDLTQDGAPDLVTGAELFRVSTDGLLPWRGRPESLKRGLVARIPPRIALKDVP